MSKKQKNSKSTTTLVIVIVAILLAVATAIFFIVRASQNSPTPDPRPRPRYDDTVLKPVLYLYPTEETDVSVSFAKPGQLTTTYPKYYGGWSVKALPDGTLFDTTGKEYYALYWEEDSDLQADQTSAFYVTKDNAIDFLESKLSYMGLNDKERNEFIMFWLPVLEKNEQSLVRFAFTEELQEDNELKIYPQPDTLFRVRIFVDKVDSNPNLPEPTLKHFERSGFTAVEWGGTKE